MVKYLVSVCNVYFVEKFSHMFPLLHYVVLPGWLIKH